MAGIIFSKWELRQQFKNASIKHAVSGIHAGNLGTTDRAPDLTLSNLIITHMSVSVLSSLGASIIADNVVIAHCGYYCAFLASGGNYSFIHCTIANQWDYSLRISPSVYISDFYDYNKDSLQ